MISLVFFLALFFTGCKPGLVSEDELLGYVRDKDNGLHKTMQRGNMEISVVHRPTDLLVAQELATKEATPDAVEEFRSKYGSYSYFVLSLSNNGRDALYSTAGSYQDFSDNLQKLSFRMNEYVQLTTSAKDTVELLDFHFPRMHGMGGSTQVLLAFKEEQIEHTEWIQLNLKEMGFGTGRVNVRFRMDDIISTPNIDFLNRGNSL